MTTIIDFNQLWVIITKVRHDRHYHLSLMIFVSTNIFSDSEYNKKKSADCYDFAKTQLFQLVITIPIIIWVWWFWLIRALPTSWPHQDGLVQHWQPRGYMLDVWLSSYPLSSCPLSSNQHIIFQSLITKVSWLLWFCPNAYLSVNFDRIHLSYVLRQNNQAQMIRMVIVNQ